MPASITATTTTPCPCCSLPNALQCRVRGDTASLCGHSEFTSPSTPPKKYRKKEASGRIDDRTWTASSCTFPGSNGEAYENSGHCTYDSATCATTNTLALKFYFNAPGYPATTLISTTPQACSWGDAPNSDSCLVTWTTNQTQKTSAGTAACCSSGSEDRVRSGGVEFKLSEEDTEADSIARFQAATSWGSWIASGGTGCTGTPPSCCLAKYESRTSGFSFGYAEAEARVTATGLTPSTGYTAKIELYRRPYGSGTFAHYQTATVTGTSDGSGNLTTSAATVTNTKGYETYAAASSLFTT